MNDFQNELQRLNLGEFQSSEVVPWDQNQYYMAQARQCGGGFNRCFRCFSCFFCFFFTCFNCFNCFGCSRCGGCGGHCGRCGGH